MFSSWLAFFVIGLICSQIIIMLVTVYFHRACSHKSVNLSPAVNKVARFLSWFLIAMVPQEFAAVHRKHHAKCDTEEDPHSPRNHGWHGVLFGGLGLYRKEIQNAETIEKYGKGLPYDSWEGFYRKNPNLGIFSFALLLVVLLGLKGLLLWGVMMLWIPFWAAGVVNGLGHHLGYRNYQTSDLSTNLSPWGLWIGGEELHNNHHAYPASAKFSKKWFEIDLGWGLIVVLRAFGLATVREEKASSGLLGFLGGQHHWVDRLHQALHHHTKEDLKSIGLAKWKKLSSLAFSLQDISQTKKDKLQKALSNHNLKGLLELEKDFRSFWENRQRFSHEKLDEWKEKARNFNLPKLTALVDDLSLSLNPQPSTSMA